jgi:dipeptidyl aminopeptidase/acylaminoacyl peptidase
LKIEKTTIANKPFLDAKIVATNTGSRRIRGIVLSSVSTKFAFLFGISAILLLPSLLVIPTNQSAWAGTFPGPNGQIAFSSNRNGNFEIYTMNDDGSDVTRLTEDDANDFDPIWSPDGDKIAFVSDRDSTGDIDEPGDITAIYSMNADDGSDVTRLTDDDANHLYPTWSPDGKRIAFSSNREGGENYEIYDMNADDGSDVTRLTDNDADDREPDWGTNTSTPGDDDGDDDKNKHDSKKKHHDDNAKKKH